MNLSKISFSVILLITFSCCNFKIKSKEIIDMNNFENLISGNISSLADVANLFANNAQDVKARSNMAIEIAQKDLENFLQISPQERTFENTAKNFDKLRSKFYVAAVCIETLSMINPDKEVIKASLEESEKLRNFAVDAFCNKEIYKAFKYYQDINFKKEDLNDEEKYFIDEMNKDFKRNGFDLPDDKFEEVKKIKKEIEKLSLDFEANINQDNSQILVEKSDLDGLEEDFINSLQKDNSGKYILKCDYPTQAQIMENCKVEKTRKDFYFKFNQRAYPANIEILNKVTEKRDLLAKMLGFESFAHLNLDDEMAKNPNIINKFLNELSPKFVKKADKEFKELTKNLPKDIKLDQTGKFNAWDYAYLKSLYKKNNFNIDERFIAQHFPVDNTLNKIFEIYQSFLNLEFKLTNSAKFWDKDVYALEVYNKTDNKLLGYLLLDLYPRENKYSHACMNPVVQAVKQDGSNSKSVILIIANFPKATASKPALLTHRDVETFFHEFGHAMHEILGKTEMYGFVGTNVKRDFVELPSQMFEEWLWDKDILKNITKHYQTGQSLPDDIIEKKISLKKFDSGHTYARQCYLALLSLEIFAKGGKKDVDSIKKNLHEKLIKTIRFEPESFMQASFGHLMGYGARYYSYLWSKVFAIDIFYEIKKHGLTDNKIGELLKNYILNKGGSVDPNILLKKFLKRAPNQEAFLDDLGI